MAGLKKSASRVMASDEKLQTAALKTQAHVAGGPLSGASEVIIGETLNARYRIELEISRGGMGVVYLARDQQLHLRPVVVKVLLDETLHSEYVVQKFRQEIEALSRLDHPGIV